MADMQGVITEVSASKETCSSQELLDTWSKKFHNQVVDLGGHAADQDHSRHESSLARNLAAIVNSDSRMHHGQQVHVLSLINRLASSLIDIKNTDSRRDAFYDGITGIANFVNGCRG